MAVIRALFDDLRQYSKRHGVLISEYLNSRPDLAAALQSEREARRLSEHQERLAWLKAEREKAMEKARLLNPENPNAPVLATDGAQGRNRFEGADRDAVILFRELYMVASAAPVLMQRAFSDTGSGTGGSRDINDAFVREVDRYYSAVKALKNIHKAVGDEAFELLILMAGHGHTVMAVSRMLSRKAVKSYRCAVAKRVSRKYKASVRRLAEWAEKDKNKAYCAAAVR